MNVESTLRSFDQFLASRKLSLEAVVIGGAALNLLGILQRPTKDCDILHPALPPEIAESARLFAASSSGLAADWLNNGPSSLANALPKGWESRLQPCFAGTAITLKTLGRSDLLCSKLFALCDRAIDLQDCIQLAPTKEELEQIKPWLSAQDGNPDWPKHVEDTLQHLLEEVKHAVRS